MISATTGGGVGGGEGKSVEGNKESQGQFKITRDQSPKGVRERVRRISERRVF